MGISFVDYVNYKRIKKAERLLLTGDLSIMEVSFDRHTEYGAVLQAV